MGNCTTQKAEKPFKNYASSIQFSIPTLFFIDFDSEILTKINPKESYSINLKTICIYKDSSISTLTEDSLIIAGGTDSSGSLTSSIYLLSLQEKSLTKLPNLPVPSKHGVFLDTPSFFYYISGICKSSDPNPKLAEEASPLCRLNKISLKWEVFICEEEFDSSKILQKRIDINETTEKISTYASTGLQLNDLQEPGAIIYTNKLVLIGGKVFKNEYKASNRIFSICLEDKFSVNEENFCLPVPLSSPSCSVKAHCVYVASGFLQDTSPNFQIFVIDLIKGAVWKMGTELYTLAQPRYPIFVDEKGVAFVSNSKVLYLIEEKNQFFSFSVSPAKKIYDLGMVSQREGGELEKKTTNLRVNFILDEKIEEITERTENNPFGGMKEDLNLLVASYSETPIQLKLINCSCGVLITQNVQLNSTKICVYCNVNKQKLYYCDKCCHILCKSCAKSLENFKIKKNPKLKCRNNHFFCSPDVPASEDTAEVCVNCSKPMKINLFCFICQSSLCFDCEKAVNFFSSLTISCSKFHSFSWKLNQSALLSCQVCLSQISQIGFFFCESCEFFLCFVCVSRRFKSSPSDLCFIKGCSFQSQPKKLSDTLLKLEFNNGDDPTSDRKKSIDKIKGSSATKETIFKKHKKEKFETDPDEFKKKFIPKPIRSLNPPFLSSSLSKSSRLVGLQLSSESLEKDPIFQKKQSGYKTVRNVPFQFFKDLLENEKLKTQDLFLQEEGASRMINPLESRDFSLLKGSAHLDSFINSIGEIPNETVLENRSKALIFQAEGSAPKVDPTLGDETGSVAPDIRGSLAVAKLNNLKAKLNLLVSSEPEDFSSLSEDEDLGFNLVTGLSGSGKSLEQRGELSVNNRESKRYTIENDGFSIDEEKKDEVEI